MDPDYIKLKEIKPALSGYIRKSQLMLKINDEPDEIVVHDVRVLMKKSRAVLNLASTQLEPGYFNRDIIAFREVGRVMCGWRESSVHRKTLKELRKEFPDIFSRLLDNKKVASLMSKPELLQEHSGEIKSGLEQINDLLNKASYRIRFEPMNKFDPHGLLKELENTYHKAVEAYLISRNDPKPKNLHEFRKKSKTFLYQLYFFRPLNPVVIKALEKKLDTLTQNLGKYNDLTQLVTALEYSYPNNENLPVVDELVLKIREKQDRYLSKVWPSAFNAFCPGKKLVNVLGFKLLVI